MFCMERAEYVLVTRQNGARWSAVQETLRLWREERAARFKQWRANLASAERRYAALRHASQRR